MSDTLMTDKIMTAPVAAPYPDAIAATVELAASHTPTDAAAPADAGDPKPPSKRRREGAVASKPSRQQLPEELRDDEEASAVWGAARLAGADNREAFVRGWHVTWRPRATANGHKRVGDMYIYPPRDAYSANIGTIRSLANLSEALLTRKAARDAPAGSELWMPPMSGSLVEVRLRSEEKLEENSEEVADGAAEAGGGEQPAVWRCAEVRRVDPSRSFHVVLHDAEGVADESWTRCCDAFDENMEWRRLESSERRVEHDPLVAGAPVAGKRRTRCGVCAGCLSKDCGTCSACRDKPKFGGAGTAKQACVRRRCSQPQLPHEMGNPWLCNGALETVRKVSRLGADYQADLPRPSIPSVKPFPATPPLCYCALPAVWWRQRWWCRADEPRACAFELVCPPSERTPLCECGERAAWDARGRVWTCARLPSAGGCAMASPQAEHAAPASPTLESAAEIEIAAAKRTAARLTAAAYREDAVEVALLSEEEDEEAADEETCQVCGSAENEHLLLLCDGKAAGGGPCSAAVHTFCLSPPLTRVPEGEWYCADCAGGGTRPGGTPRGGQCARRPAVAAAHVGEKVASQEPTSGLIEGIDEDAEAAPAMAAASARVTARTALEWAFDTGPPPLSRAGRPARAAADKAVQVARRLAAQELRSEEEESEEDEKDGARQVPARSHQPQGRAQKPPDMAAAQKVFSAQQGPHVTAVVKSEAGKSEAGKKFGAPQSRPARWHDRTSPPLPFLPLTAGLYSRHVFSQRARAALHPEASCGTTTLASGPTTRTRHRPPRRRRRRSGHVRAGRRQRGCLGITRRATGCRSWARMRGSRTLSPAPMPPCPPLALPAPTRPRAPTPSQPPSTPAA